MHLDDQAPPVAPWLVFCSILRRAAPLSTTRLAHRASQLTDHRVGRYLPSVLSVLVRLEEEGVVSSTRPDRTRPTRVWQLTADGTAFLDEAHAMACACLDVDPTRRHGDSHGPEKQRTKQRREQRHEQRR